MKEQFRIKEGGRGNVVSNAQTKGLSQIELRERNSLVDATPFAPDYESVLIILYNNRYEEQLQALFEAFNKKATNYLEDLSEIAEQASSMFNGANPPSFLIVYAKPLMQNKTLIHYNRKPQLHAGGDGSYQSNSNQILLSNGGKIEAGLYDSECIFYHPFAWKYIVERLEFFVNWEAVYEGYEIGSSDALLESEAVPYGSDYGRFIGFAPFGFLPKGGASTVGQVGFAKESQLPIPYAWERPSYVEQYTQMREGESYANWDTAPLKYMVDYVPSVKLSEIFDDGLILDDESIDFIPIFVTYSDSDTLPLTKVIPNKTDNTYPIGIAISSVESVIDLAQLQRYSKLKTPYKRSTNLETRHVYMEDVKYVARDYMQEWAEKYLVPPHMSNEEWWEAFYERLASHLYWADKLECGEYDDGSGSVCGVVYAMSQQFRLADDYVYCKAYELPYGTQGMQSNIFRSTDYAGDYKTVMTGVQVGANDDFYVNSEINFSTRFYTGVKFRIKMNISSSWSTLPEEVVRNSLKNHTHLDRAIFTDGKAESGLLESSKGNFPTVGTDYGASIPLADILQAEGVDFDNMPLEELVSKLRAGFSLRYQNYDKNSTYISIGSRPVNLVNDWRNK